MYNTCRSTNLTAFETSELTRGLSSTHQCGMPNPNKFVIEKNNDNETKWAGTGRPTASLDKPRQDHGVRWSNVTLSSWSDWALLYMAVCTTQEIGVPPNIWGKLILEQLR